MWGQDSCFFGKDSFLGGQMILLDHGSVIAELKSDIASGALSGGEPRYRACSGEGNARDVQPRGGGNNQPPQVDWFTAAMNKKN